MNFDTANIGRRVRIVRISTLAAANASNFRFIGQEGVIVRALKGSRSYAIKLSNGLTWRADADNVESV